jgi:hypothetical protein
MEIKAIAFIRKLHPILKNLNHKPKKMKAKSKTTKTLQIITGIVAVLWLAAIVGLLYEGRLPINLVDTLTLVFFIIFLTGFAFSWKRMKTAGIVLMICNAGIWFLDNYIVGYQSDSPSGLPSLVSSPVMFIGALFLLEWYKTSKASVPSEPQQWKFILRTLLVNYAVLYAIIVFSELSDRAGVNQVDYTGIPFIKNPLLLLAFIMGFIISWKNEFIAGIIFLFWCTIFLYGMIAYPEILRSAPWKFSGIPILFQGLIYIKHHYEFGQKKICIQRLTINRLIK